MSRLLQVSVPPVTQEFFDRLEAAFRPIEVTPDSRMSDIMFDAGQQSVLRWVKGHIGQTQILGSVELRSDANTRPNRHRPVLEDAGEHEG